MSNCIIKIKNKYFIWSDNIDAPITRGMSWPDLIEYLIEESKIKVLKELENQAERIIANGTSSLIPGINLKECIYLNRAGENESCLTEDEIYERYK